MSVTPGCNRLETNCKGKEDLYGRKQALNFFLKILGIFPKNETIWGFWAGKRESLTGRFLQEGAWSD